jgi:hypothetical protein
LEKPDGGYPVERLRSPVELFLSYTHDSREHRNRVLAFVENLRRDGIDAQLDQFVSSPPEGWPRWMVNRIASARFVLVVCTDHYCRRFEGHEPGGAQWEGGVITQELYDSNGKNQKFVPIGFAPHSDGRHVPVILRPWTYYDVSQPDGYEALYRLITDQPDVTPAELGEVRSLGSLRPPDVRLDKCQWESDERLCLLQTLTALPSPIFGQIAFALPMPKGLLPQPASQIEQSIALLNWVDGPTGCGLHALQDLLDHITTL